MVTLEGEVRIGCAGWSIPAAHGGAFPGEGTHLQRYAGVFDAAEINSSFHRPHRRATYERWAASVPADFRFSVKLPKEITHTRKLVDAEEPLDRFLSECAGLGEKFGPLLVQLPPKLAFEAETADGFFSILRARFDGAVACEPRHPTWFAPEADALLVRWRAARVAADPAVVPAAAEPGGWDGIAYFRLHGSPRIYYSDYPDDFLRSLARKAADLGGRAPAWVIFDNTASGAATGNALALRERLRG